MKAYYIYIEYWFVGLLMVIFHYARLALQLRSNISCFLQYTT